MPQSSSTAPYDPFARGGFAVGVRALDAVDPARGRVFPCDVWFPESDAGPFPLVAYSHPSGGNRRSATFLTTHLASHGYVVAALDHSEVVAAELARRPDETADEKRARSEAWVANRVPDVRVLLDRALDEVGVDAARVGIVGHSFGGWTALAATAVDSRIKAVVALAPGGSSNPPPGMLRAPLTFEWGRDVPTLLLVAEDDACLPLSEMYEIFGRLPATKQMVILRRADHMHFTDDVETIHEAMRTMAWPEELAWLPNAMRPIGELCSGAIAHLFVRGLTLAHMDAVLKQRAEARRFLAGDVAAELAARGVDATVAQP